MVEDYGYCEVARWECHGTEECGKLAKCDGRHCLCQDNVCETKQTLNPVTPEPGEQKDRGWGVDFKNLHLDPPWFCKGRVDIKHFDYSINNHVSKCIFFNHPFCNE